MRSFWGLASVFTAAVLFTVVKLWLWARELRGQPGQHLAVDIISFSKRYFLSPGGITVGVVIFVAAFLLADFLSKR